jgi:hypothetical protein
MANVVQTVVTTVWHRKLAKTFARSGAVIDPRKQITSFKIGEGGWALVSGNPNPVTPLPSRVDLESEGEVMDGTALFTAASTSVVGTGTAFLTQTAVGRFVKKPNTDVWGEVASIADDTHLTLVSPWAGTTGSAAPRSAREPWFTFRKTLLTTDVVETSPDSGVLLVTCLVTGSEANDDGFAAAPEFYELGLFDSDGTMVTYETFPIETKVLGRSLKHEIRVTY